MRDAREIDAEVAEKVMGLKPGVDFYDFPEHEWRRDEDDPMFCHAPEAYGERCSSTVPTCVRCGAHGECCASWHNHIEPRCTKRPPSYGSGDGMLLVIEAMRDRHRLFVTLENDATLAGDETPTTWFVAKFSNFVEGDEDRVGQAEHRHAPMAVALAALKALKTPTAGAAGDPK